MFPSSDPFGRTHHNRARVALTITTAAGSAAWSPAGQTSVARPEYRLHQRLAIEPGDRALPIVYRN